MTGSGTQTPAIGSTVTATATVATKPSDLAAESRAEFQLDFTYYVQMQKDYKEENSNVQKLREWVSNNVATHYFQVCCPSDKSLPEWIENVKKQVSVSELQIYADAKDRYNAALTPLKKPKDWNT